MGEELCGVCGEPYYRHMLSGGLRTCPFTAFSYRPARSRTITKEQVEEAARHMAKAARVPEDIGWRIYQQHALAAAKAFGLVVED